jgi:hypothetical protein
MLDAQVREGRIEDAHNHKVAGWTGLTECIEFSISDAKAKELGFDLSDSKWLDEKVKDGKRLNGLYMLNNSCPKAESIDELEELCGLLGTDLLKLGNAKVRTEFQNKCRGFLNAPAESKKAIADRIAKAEKQKAGEDIQARLQAGEIDMAEAMAQMQALL